MVLIKLPYTVPYNFMYACHVVYLFFTIVCVVFLSVLIRLINKLYAVDGLIVGADGIPWWSPSQVLATNYCVCKCMCVLFRDL